MLVHLRRILNGVVGLYTGLVLFWLVLHNLLGDTVWWLALLSAFTPFLFLPLVMIVPLGFWVRQRTYWAVTMIPLFVFLALYGQLFLPTWFRGATASQSSFTVMSFNVWAGSHKPETANAILAKAPDFVALQELTPLMADVLIEVVGDIYPYRLFRFDAPRSGLGILSRHPLTALDSQRLSGDGSEIQVAWAKVGTQSLTLYNCRLQASNVLAYLKTDDTAADEVGASFRARKAVAERLRADIASREGPIILAGDFNSTDQSDVYAILTSNLTDAHGAVGWGFGHTFPAYAGTYRGIPIISRQMRLDMIFYSDAFVALKSYVSSLHGESDHLPVLARLAWRK